MKKLIVLEILIFTLISINSWALSGKQIAQKAYDVESGDTAISKVEMILVSKSNSRRVRRFLSLRKEKSRGDIKSIIKFLSPNDIKNTSLLTLDKLGQDSVQRIYLPAMKKIRRVSSSGKGKRFANSDIFYEDFNKREVKEDKHKRLKDGVYEGKKCFVIESTPKKKSSTSYKKTKAWIDPKTFLALKVEYYRKKRRPIKILRVKKIKKIQGIWSVLLSEIEDLDYKHKTILKINSIRYNIRIKDSVFGARSLENSDALNSFAEKL